MLQYEDQEDLLRLIARDLKSDVECWAFGGTAMMYLGYKQETKDVDLCFIDEDQRALFIDALRDLGFTASGVHDVYDKRRSEDAGKPLMFRRENYRLDLFVKKIFRTALSERMREDISATHDYREGRLLRVHVLSEEHLLLLKAVTDRQRDADDMRIILEKQPRFRWQKVIDEAISQHAAGDDRVLLDLEEKMQGLKRWFLIDKRYFDALYAAQK